jgi:uncharacterized protein (TIGR02453 family)
LDKVKQIMIHPETMQFLADMACHPTKEWFEDHRADYVGARANVAEMVNALMRATSLIDKRVVVANPGHRKCISGIGSRGASKAEFAVAVRVSDDARAIATYFVHVRPAGCYSGGRTPVARLARLLRQQMMTDTGRWREIVEGPVFRKFFPYGLSDGVKISPSACFAKNHDAMESFNLKGFGACRPHADQLMQSDDAVGEIVRTFAASRSLIDYINRATTR